MWLNGVPDDLDPTVGSFAVPSFTLGVWNISLTGQTKTAFGSTTLPKMVFTSITASSSAGGTLTVRFSEDGFGPCGFTALASFSGTFESGLAGRPHIKPTVARLSSPKRPCLPPKGRLHRLVALMTAEVAGAAYGPGSPFALTQVLTISHAGAGNSSHTARLDSPVPDGGSTVVLLGAGVAALAFFSGRRKSLVRA